MCFVANRRFNQITYHGIRFYIRMRVTFLLDQCWHASQAWCCFRRCICFFPYTKPIEKMLMLYYCLLLCYSKYKYLNINDEGVFWNIPWMDISNDFLVFSSPAFLFFKSLTSLWLVKDPKSFVPYIQTFASGSAYTSTFTFSRLWLTSDTFVRRMTYNKRWTSPLHFYYNIFILNFNKA